jgi:bacterioferritin (cytochrome b1)
VYLNNYQLAGLQHIFAPGFSVAQAVERLRRFAYVERRFMRLLSSRIVSIPYYEVKALLARFQYEDALHADSWQSRILEMRTNKSQLERVPDLALEILFDEAEHIPGTYPFLAAVAHVLKPALCEAYRAYQTATNDLADYPSVHLLRHNLADEEEHLQLLTVVLDRLHPTEEERCAGMEWEEILTSFLAAAGGIDGIAPRTEARPRYVSGQPYHIPHQLVRDEMVPRVWDYVSPSLEDIPAYLDYMMGLRMSELNVTEGLAIVIFETPAMPWSFYLGISRHCWDEMRHSLFGRTAIVATYADPTAVPMRDYEGVFVMEASPLEQYAVLGLEVEGKNMKYPPGKRQEWEFARDIAKHPLMTTFQDFDWADEVLHVNLARRQLDTWFEGGLKAISPLVQSGKEHRTVVKHRHSPVALPYHSSSI